MEGANLRQQLKNHIQSMKDQGILDDHFDHVQKLQTEVNPCFLLDIVTVFCQDAENSIAELTKYLDEPAVDYAKVTAFVHQLKGSSSSVGGNRMALACRELRRASEDNKKEECLQALDKINREYNTLRDGLNAISQKVRTILTNEGGRRGRQ
ncbi:histidine-containing phosphotransfer protein 1-like [Alnus glutinosa]|uniref:histidine-containing phosphotransfer protein 1-like n=1 Tax=Alnus glutinosa TaxID=3517 RepID=UPI002D792A00|nr:histidine-containing phosphotransfer protein 1-like [Alnus glutinosa]